ncbi:hypothetical protein C8Q74DRAFT_1289622 [Fomes fomentarius]|nr:hypothetical protein C8Q74DRAFT_1289622 [Fomes fomentarius]
MRDSRHGPSTAVGPHVSETRTSRSRGMMCPVRPKLMPVIRCAIVCWVSAVLMIMSRISDLKPHGSSKPQNGAVLNIQDSLRGIQGSFLRVILISSFLDTPFPAVLEEEIVFLTFVVTATIIVGQFAMLYPSLVQCVHTSCLVFSLTVSICPVGTI